jgi:hypothetical protein
MKDSLPWIAHCSDNESIEHSKLGRTNDAATFTRQLANYRTSVALNTYPSSRNCAVQIPVYEYEKRSLPQLASMSSFQFRSLLRNFSSLLPCVSVLWMKFIQWMMKIKLNLATHGWIQTVQSAWTDVFIGLVPFPFANFSASILRHYLWRM